MGCASALPPGPAHLGDGRRRRYLCGQRPQDGCRIRAGVGFPRPRGSGRYRSAEVVCRTSHHHQPERVALRGDRRLAPPDGRAGRRIAHRGVAHRAAGPYRTRPHPRDRGDGGRTAGGAGLARPRPDAGAHGCVGHGGNRLRRRGLAPRTSPYRCGPQRPPPDSGHPVDGRHRRDRRPAGRRARRVACTVRRQRIPARGYSCPGAPGPATGIGDESP